MITAINCKCGNQDPSKAKYYEGALGYEAIICTECGRYSDAEGQHACNDWSITYLSPGSTERQIYAVLMANTQVENRYLGGDDEPIVSIRNSEEIPQEQVCRELAAKIFKAFNP